MERGQIIDLHIGGALASCHINNVEQTTSLHTGQTLYALSGEVRIRGDAVASQFASAIADGPVRASDRSTGHETTWQVRSRSYSISSGLYIYTLELKQHEDLQLERILVNGQQFAVAQYAEREEAGGILVEAVLIVPKADNATFQKLLLTRDQNQYHKVQRVGISDEILEARFGFLSPWSEHEDDFRYTIMLIDRRSDENRRAQNHKPMTLNLEAQNAHATLAYRVELMERLTTLLIQKGILSESEVENARSEAVAAAPIRALRFSQVDDAAGFFG